MSVALERELPSVAARTTVLRRPTSLMHRPNSNRGSRLVRHRDDLHVFCPIHVLDVALHLPTADSRSGSFPGDRLAKGAGSEKQWRN